MGGRDGMVAVGCILLVCSRLAAKGKVDWLELKKERMYFFLVFFGVL